MNWMAWTLPTALFFASIGLMLATLTVLELKKPTAARKGFLPIETTRGDRVFISLITAGFIHLAWLAATDLAVPWASALALATGIGIMSRG